MTHRFLPDVALADVAFEAESESLGGLFESSAEALTDVMVDRSTVKPSSTRTISVAAEDPDRLLYDFLSELIILKDVDSLLFREFSVDIAGDSRSLKCLARGEAIDRVRHRLRNDVKAVTMHLFGIKTDGGRYAATVVLDI